VLWRASPVIALLSQINPPRNHTIPNKMLIEHMAADYTDAPSLIVRQISIVI
jgi:hypothetical protein